MPIKKEDGTYLLKEDSYKILKEDETIASVYKKKPIEFKLPVFRFE